jgi:pyruvate dehydrogenase E2 component (dihydrolipoamide acetyltransferase)
VPTEHATAVVERARAAGVSVTVTDTLIRACAAAAHAHPAINAWLDEDALLEFDNVGVALAVDTADGVIAPVLRAAQTLGLRDIAELRRRLVTGAREGTLDLHELAGATISLSNVGSHGAHQLTPVLTVPQVAVIGVGSARDTAAGQCLAVTLVGDHRAIDGAQGARFLAAFDEALNSTPEA